MTIHLGVVMDPIQSIHYKKDSTLAMLWEAQSRGYKIEYFEPKDLFLRDGLPFGLAKRLSLFHDPTHYFSYESENLIALSELDVILMRKDPPFNQNYIYITYILECAQNNGVLVVNRAQSLRDCNEKFFATQFPQCMTDTLVTQSKNLLMDFWHEHGDIVCKPLHNMGGASVLRLKKEDVNFHVIFDLLTENSTYIMAQKFIKEIAQGDKRILMLNGTAFPYALARVPQEGDWRGNLAVGAIGNVVPLSLHDQYIAEQVGPLLRAKGLYFVGLDVIGNYLTEINVTSPTGIRELEAATGLSICAQLFELIEAELSF